MSRLGALGDACSPCAVSAGRRGKDRRRVPVAGGPSAASTWSQFPVSAAVQLRRPRQRHPVLCGACRCRCRVGYRCAASYRPLEIDKLISRTISLAILTELLVAVFTGIVVLSTHVLPFSSPVGSRRLDARRCGAVQPAAQGGFQHAVDRRFNRRKAGTTPEAIVATFTLRASATPSISGRWPAKELLRAVDQGASPAPRTHRSGSGRRPNARELSSNANSFLYSRQPVLSLRSSSDLARRRSCTARSNSGRPISVSTPFFLPALAVRVATVPVRGQN